MMSSRKEAKRDRAIPMRNFKPTSTRTPTLSFSGMMIRLICQEVACLEWIKQFVPYEKSAAGDFLLLCHRDDGFSTKLAAGCYESYCAIYRICRRSRALH